MEKASVRCSQAGEQQHVESQILRRDPIAAGREEEVEETLQFVSALVSDSAITSAPAPSPDPSPSQSDPKEGFG